MCVRTVTSPAIYRGAKLPTGSPTQLPLGAELIGNGSFADASVWTLSSAQWAIAAGVATRTAGGGADYLSQPLALSRGKYVRLSYDVSAITATPVTLFVNLIGAALNVLAGAFYGAGTLVVTVPIFNDITTYRLRASSFTGASVDNVSVKRRG